MDNVYEFFNLSTLLKLGDLDIQKVADATNMPVGKYFNLLSEFIERAPQMVDSLNQIAAFEDIEKSLKNLDHLMKLLGKMGYNRLGAPIEEIIYACKDEDMAKILPFIKPILNGFNRLFSRLLTAKIPRNVSNPYGNISLSSALEKALKKLNFDEATRKPRIMAIDDMLFILQSVSQILGKEYKVYKLTNSKMLEEALQYVTPELFLLDYDMPERIGFDLVPIIRSYEVHKTTPIIFLTSTGTIDKISAAIKLGAADYMTKPFKAAILRQKVAANIVKKNLFKT